MKIAGKLTVDGLIDPIGLVLNNQTSTNPNQGNNDSKTTIWSDNGTLKFQNGILEIFRLLLLGSTSTGSGGVTGNTDAANKIALARRGQDNTGAINHNNDYRICFTDEGPTTVR